MTICLMQLMLEIHSREHVKPIFQKIAAKADGQPCCDWVNNFSSDEHLSEKEIFD